MDSDNLIIYVILAFVFALQLFFCLKLKPVIVKLIPTILSVIAAVALFIRLQIPDSFEGWEALGYVVWFLIALMAVGACALAWIIYGVVQAIKKSKAKKQI